MRVRLMECRRETPDVTTFVFSLGGQPYEYVAGQFAFFDLDRLTVQDPRDKRRHFTLSSSPTEHDIVQFTTKLRGSGFKQTLLDASVGLEVDLELPRGCFTLPETADQPLVFLGGGIGVTPFRSMLRFATDELLPHKITMLYSAPTPEHLVFRSEFQSLPEENPNAHIICIVTEPGTGIEWHGETGRIDEDKIRKYVADIPDSLFYTCGPPPMVQEIKELLLSMSVARQHIRVERFSGYT